MKKTEEKLDESKETIIKDFFSKRDDPYFRWFKIQAWPWTWKTFLLKKILEKLSSELKEQNISAISFSNSAIDTISSKLWHKNTNIQVQTIASFFIENFIIPFGYSILQNEDLKYIEYKKDWEYKKIAENDIKVFLSQITNNFSENNIKPFSNWWDILNWIIKKYWTKDKYFNLVHKIIIQKNIKYIFIDEYQDTQDYCVGIFNRIIEKWEIKFFCVWDKHQKINYEEENKIFELLEERTLETTYRFWRSILDYTNKILESWIKKPSDNMIWSVKKVNYNDWIWLNDEEIKKIISSIIKWIENNKNTFKWKNNVILFQPATDYWFWDNFNKKLDELLKDNKEICFSHTEKPIYNIHLKLFFEKIITFVNWNKNLRYWEIEKELSFFYEKWENKQNFKRVFWEILKLKTTDEIKNIWNLLKDWFKLWWKHKEYFDEIVRLLNKWKTTFEQAKNKQLLDLIDIKESEKVYFSTNTITSAKWKEYDNVIILNIYNKENFSSVLKNNQDITKQTEAKRHYYVGISRAKENVFTFVDYWFDDISYQ